MNATCSTPGCDRPARGSLCERCWSRRRRGKPLEAPGQRSAPATLEAADALLQLAAIAYADAPAELADAAYQELLRAHALRAEVLGRGQGERLTKAV